MVSPQGERTSALEVRVANLEKKFDELNDNIKSVEGKLDELLAFKNKGAGAILLLSTIFGTGMVSIFIAFFNFFSHKGP